MPAFLVIGHWSLVIGHSKDMPARQPFTELCQLAAQAALPRPGADRADLHLHTTHSDGDYTPRQVVELALRAGLCALAVTDHDTLAGVEPTRFAAGGTRLEVVTGVEISTEFQGRELHLLGYLVSLDDAPLAAALEHLRENRIGRYQEMVDRLRDQGVQLPEEETRGGAAGHALGRRHLAEALVRAGKTSTVREAFSRYLHDGARAVVPKALLPVAEAISLVREAGGVASWAHPPERCTLADLAALQEMGLGAVEAEYPGFRASRVKSLRTWAETLGLAITGGSDCHGPGSADRTVGARSISRAELEELRGRCQAVARD
jgi:3',5'-nucleoside bisphosphate phosphatase